VIPADLHHNHTPYASELIRTAPEKKHGGLCGLIPFFCFPILPDATRPSNPKQSHAPAPQQAARRVRMAAFRHTTQQALRENTPRAKSA
jgi:hypothetical protein